MKWQLGRLASAAAIGIVATTCSALAADPPKSVRIGYAISLSGPNAQGAAITTLSGYKLWVDDVNKKGGLKVQGFDKRIPIEVVEYDDTSNAENAVRLVERLMTQDKVDFVLPPWSTGFNLATAPVFARNGYPQLAVTANSNDAANLVKQMPTLFAQIQRLARRGRKRWLGLAFVTQLPGHLPRQVRLTPDPFQHVRHPTNGRSR